MSGREYEFPEGHALRLFPSVGPELSYSNRNREEQIKMPNHPLAEVFGFPPDNHTAESKRYRENRLCPYNNRVPNCTKDKAEDPLGVVEFL